MRPLLTLILLVHAIAATGATGAVAQSGLDTVPRFRPDAATIASAYDHPDTRTLVERARGHRGMIDSSVFAYSATVRQRVSAGLRALRRDRLLYRRETAAHIDWRRDGASRVEVLGAREAVPVAVPGLQVPDDLERFALELVPQPGDARLFATPDDDGFAWHPLIEGGEEVYTYATGDTTTVRLPDGRRIRLVELRVRPREPDIRHVAGSFWIELDDHAIVHAVFRPSRDFDLERDLAEIDAEDADEVEEVPELLKPIRFDLEYVVVEYGLWEMRWWMPRVVAIEGGLRVGPATFPIRFEMAYSDYRIEADPLGLPALPPVIRDIAGDPSDEPRPYEYPTIVVLADSADLLDSPLLPESLYSEAPLLSEGELRDIADRIGVLPPPPWEWTPPRVRWPWQLGTGLLRYNRVEGLSAGMRVDWDLTRARFDLTARLGTAELEPEAVLGFEWRSPGRTWRTAAYHRIAAVDPLTRPFGLGNSLSALLLGRDDGQYFRSSGAELLVTPTPGGRHYEVRLYAERQAAESRETEFSLPHLLDTSHRFRPNIDAEPADQLGVAATIGVDHGLDPLAFRWGAWLDVRAEVGDHEFVRPGLTLMTGGPLGIGLLGWLEGAVGTTLGSGPQPAPVQSLWYLGGPTSVRGFPGGHLAGEDFARGRVEVGTPGPAFRVVLFSDIGWAGAFESAAMDDALLSAGIGASLLDGLLRVDLARTIRPETDWRLESYVAALF